MSSESISIRPAVSADKEFILSIVPRLVEFGPPPWRDADEMTATDMQVIGERVGNTGPGIVIFVAEDGSGTPLGFIHLVTATDYFTRKDLAHIADIIIAPQGEGRGVARALITRAEEWAREKGFKWIKLGVFAQNRHARTVYEHLGFNEDITTYIKELD